VTKILSFGSPQEVGGSPPHKHEVQGIKGGKGRCPQGQAPPIGSRRRLPTDVTTSPPGKAPYILAGPNRGKVWPGALASMRHEYILSHFKISNFFT
jgi:hypothetical protein